jgi:hypothetical protein
VALVAVFLSCKTSLIAIVARITHVAGGRLSVFLVRAKFTGNLNGLATHAVMPGRTRVSVAHTLVVVVSRIRVDSFQADEPVVAIMMVQLKALQ